MFSHSVQETPGGVAHILCSTPRCCARYMTFIVWQLKKCFGLGGIIGYLCLRVVLTAMHLVTNKGHITHAQQQRLMGFLKFCRVFVNMVYGYSGGSCSTSWMWRVSLGSGCICSFSGLSFALTSLCFREGLFLYAMTGGSGKIPLNVLLFWISFQCF